MFVKYPFLFLTISILLAVFGQFYHSVFYLVLLGYYVYIFRKFTLKTTVFIALFTIVFVFTMQYPSVSKETIIQGTIISQDEKSIYLKTDTTKVKVYGDFAGYNEGDELEMEVSYFDIAEATNDNAFNYKNYLYSIGVTSQATCVTITQHIPHHTLYQELKKRVESNSNIQSYASMFVLGVKDEQMKGMYEQLTNLSVVHLFALSGMQIHILKKWLKSMLRFFINDRWLEYTSLIIIGIYMYTIPYNISFSRAYFVMLLYTIAKRYITRMDALAIVCVVVLFLNPYTIYNVSFIFSYSMYAIVLLLKEHKYANYIMYLSSIPIILTIQYQINVLSIILGVILIPIVDLLYIAILWYLVFGNLVAPFIEIIVYFFTNIVVFANDISVYINFSKPPLFFILAYYYFFFSAVIKVNQNRKFTRELLGLLSILLMFYFKPYYTMEGKVVMIDVGQGDCFLIKQPFSKGNILIDTGGLKNRDIASDTLVPYLKSEGIFSLDYVFISHEDYDHNGAYASLLEQIPIHNTIDTFIEKMTIGDVEIQMYQVETSSSDTNANSLVFKATVNNIQYLFTGDISEVEEEKLYQKYGKIEVDVLKVPHHGSDSSTSDSLFKFVSPKVALISCGKNNLYGHPHANVLQRLQNQGVHIYRSDLNGMVSIVYYGSDNYIYE